MMCPRCKSSCVAGSVWVCETCGWHEGWTPARAFVCLMCGAERSLQSKACWSCGDWKHEVKGCPDNETFRLASKIVGSKIKDWSLEYIESVIRENHVMRQSLFSARDEIVRALAKVGAK